MIGHTGPRIRPSARDRRCLAGSRSRTAAGIGRERSLSGREASWWSTRFCNSLSAGRAFAGLRKSRSSGGVRRRGCVPSTRSGRNSTSDSMPLSGGDGVDFHAQPHRAGGLIRQSQKFLLYCAGPREIDAVVVGKLDDLTDTLPHLFRGLRLPLAQFDVELLHQCVIRRQFLLKLNSSTGPCVSARRASSDTSRLPPARPGCCLSCEPRGDTRSPRARAGW